MPVKIEEREGKFCVVDQHGKVYKSHDSQGDANTHASAINASIAESENKTLMETVKSILSMGDGATENPLMLRKGSDGVMRWAAIYSNSFRDDDWPVKEILSAESHQLFELLVDNGVVEPPALWVWHEEDWEIGKSTWVSTWEHPQKESVVFAMAGGYIHPEAESTALALSELPYLKMSHGMYSDFVMRDEQDPSIIRLYVSKELTVLLGGKEANKFTSFATSEKGNNMAKESKKAELVQQGFPADLLDQLEGTAKELADAATVLGIDSAKEKGTEEVEEKDATIEATEEAPAEETEAIVSDVEPTEEVEAEATPVAEVEPAPEEVEVTEPDAAPAVDAEIGKAVEVALKSALKLQQDQLALIELVKSQAGELAELKTVVAELKERDEEKVQKAVANTPLASLMGLAESSIVGKDDARVDGRSKLAKSGPQAPDVGDGRTPFPLVNRMIAGSGKNG